MDLGKVIGTVVATKKDWRLEGLKLLIVEKLDMEEQPTGSCMIAVDSVGAGIGETVFVVSGSSARLTDATDKKPVDAVIAGIVDSYSRNGK